MKQRKMPFRADHEITQGFNDGTVTIYEVQDGAEPGRQPKPVLKEKVAVRFCELKLGINRIYMSRQAQAEVERLIRVPVVNVSPQDVAVTRDGRQYRISTIQKAYVFPPSLDLALTKIEQTMEVLPK